MLLPCELIPPPRVLPNDMGNQPVVLTNAQRRCHIALLCFLYVLFFLPLWVALPSLNEYVIARRCLTMYGIFNNTGSICGAPDVSESGQEWNTYIFLACNLPSVLVALPLGRLMDEHGRRPVMIICLATQLVGSAGMLSVCFFELDLFWFMPPYIINGFGGGGYILQSLFMASLSDVATSKRQRNVLLSATAAAYYACGCVGPLLGGFISGSVVGNATSPLEFFPTLGGRQYQFAYVLFFGTNALLLVLGVVFWRETLDVSSSSSTCCGCTGSNNSNSADASVAKPSHAFSSSSSSSVLSSCAASFAGAVKPLRNPGIVVVSVVFLFLYSTINVRANLGTTTTTTTYCSSQHVTCGNMAVRGWMDWAGVRQRSNGELH